MFACVYISMFVRLYVCIHTYTYIHVYVFVFLYMYIRMYVYVFKCLYMCMCFYICIYVCMCMCLNVCIYVCVFGNYSEQTASDRASADAVVSVLPHSKLLSHFCVVSVNVNQAVNVNGS